MRGFRECARGIMSNARCLTEGVDVPAVDMVAFLSPRRSRVDIVQATGRAMRRAPHKTTGYVLVPLYVEQAAAETIEEAVSRAEFDDVWDVLQSLQEQDEVLAEIIREMREERGGTKGFDDARFRERIQVLGPSVPLDALRTAITTMCIERIGAEWDERFGEFADYKAEYGHCNIRAKYIGKTQLGVWVAAQRVFKRKGKLSHDRIRRLDSLGFDWNPISTYWETMFNALAVFKSNKGHCRVPLVYAANAQLGRWVGVQRKAKLSGQLEAWKFHRLESLGFVWSPLPDAWEEQFTALCAYRQENGHVDIPAKDRENPKLGAWVVHQRKMKALGRLSLNQVAKLEALSFDWNPHKASWGKMFCALRTYVEQHGHSYVPRDLESHRKLAAWTATQRMLFKQGMLKVERVRELESLGFVWDQLDLAWEDMYAQLKTYKLERGDCDVPQGFSRNPRLAKWVETQRKRNKFGRLDPERKTRLDALGFVWRFRESLWEQMFTALVAHKNEHGHCNVPLSFQKDLALGRWLNKQRQSRRRGRLTEERTRRLTEIGLDWFPKPGKQLMRNPVT